jgi:hypothetical protein
MGHFSLLASSLSSVKWEQHSCFDGICDQVRHVTDVAASGLQKVFPSVFVILQAL